MNPHPDRRTIAIRQTLAAALALGAALALVAHLTGCGLWGERAIYAADTAVYERELDACLVEARDAGRSLAVYEQCAREADVRHGARDAGGDR